MKKFTLAVVSIFVLLFSSITFAQLDSVHYQGPYPGSVTGGAMQTTDNFSDNYTPPPGDLKEVPIALTVDTDVEFTPPAGVPISESIYVVDVVWERESDFSGSEYQTVLLNNFNGIDMTNSYPPDPTMAVGPDHIIACANSVIKIFDKDGNVLKFIPAAAWWAPVTPDENGDPQVIYDHYSNKWVLLWLQLNTATNTAANLVAYSDDENPLGTWYLYSLPTVNAWGDYPKLGYDEEALYIMDRIISWSGFYLYNQIRIIDKAEFFSSNGGPLTYKDIRDIGIPGVTSTFRPDVIHPAISFTPGSGGWFFYSRGSFNTASSGYYCMYKISNPLGTPTFRGKQLFVSTYVTPPNANQLGGGVPLETVGWMSRAPVVRDGYLHVAHDIRSTVNTSYSSVKYLKINIATNSIEENVEFGSTGYFYLYPGVTVDKDNNVAITFTRSGDNEYPGAYYTSKLSSSPPNEFIPSRAFQEGLSNYQLLQGGSRNRWGDYAGIYVDPANDSEVWMLTEYSVSTTTWGTYIAQIKMGPYSGAHVFTQTKTLDFSNVEVGTTSEPITVILANYGDEDLVITDIPESVGDFNLVGGFPGTITLPMYDSMDIAFTYTPAATGESSVDYPITSNDPGFTGLSLSGNGYIIYPALDKVIYGSSGTQNNGEILTIDKTTGMGTTVGPSLYTQVEDISIHPSTGVMYGLVSYNSTSDIVRVSAAGDSYLLVTVGIGNMSGISFDNTGELYGVTRTGDIFTINLTDGSTTTVTTGEGSYLGIAFHPTTNQLWASSRSFILPNKDAIFTVNLTTGDTTIIGHTGLDKQTNAIVFDELGNLYGVIGSSGEDNDFISIDVATGLGTIIGTVGMKHILGLAYEETGVTSVEGKTIRTPEGFRLSQNYPNPFNPETRISFSLPVSSNVEIRVYNLLGQVVQTIVGGREYGEGEHSVMWNGKDENGMRVVSGIYFYEMKAVGNNGIEYSDIKKMLLLK